MYTTRYCKRTATRLGTSAARATVRPALIKATLHDFDASLKTRRIERPIDGVTIVSERQRYIPARKGADGAGE